MHFRSAVLGVARSIMLFAYAVGIWYGAKLMIDEGVSYGTVFMYAFMENKTEEIIYIVL